MTSEFEEVLPIFEAEAAECLATLEQSLLVLESRPYDEDSLQTCFRMAHTLKGTAATLGFTEVGDLAHKLEDRLEGIQSGNTSISKLTISLLLEAVDVLRARIADALKEAHAAAPGTEISRRRATEASTLRVDRDRLDRVLNLVGEISIARARLGGEIELQGKCLPPTVAEAHQEAERLSLELQEEVLRLRMAPLGPALRQYGRTVRDLAAGLGKLVRLVIEGDDVEVDTSVIEHIRQPLTHLVRNAVDHGIETPEERRRTGKNPSGTILLRATRAPGCIELEIRDDGAGLDRGRIRGKARDRYPSMDMDRLSDREIDRLIFAPGFSTASQITEVSGRGIGLDVVRREIEAIRGQVDVKSETGKWTAFSFRLPLTLAIIDGFYIGVGEETYVLPLDSVEECLLLPRDEANRARESGVLSLRGEALPYLRLRRLLDVGGDPPSREHVVVIRHDRGRFGLVGDSLHGSGKNVIKPLKRPFQNIPGIAGSAILGSGHVALILDPGALMAKALRDPAFRAEEASMNS